MQTRIEYSGDVEFLRRIHLFAPGLPGLMHPLQGRERIDGQRVPHLEFQGFGQRNANENLVRSDIEAPGNHARRNLRDPWLEERVYTSQHRRERAGVALLRLGFHEHLGVNIGSHRPHRGIGRNRCGDRAPIRQGFADGLYSQMGVEAEDALPQLLAEAGHHSDHDH